VSRHGWNRLTKGEAEPATSRFKIALDLRHTIPLPSTPGRDRMCAFEAGPISNPRIEGAREREHPSAT